MAFSSTQYTADGSTTDFLVTFDYLEQDHVKVRVDKVFTTELGSLYKFNWLNSTTIRVDTVTGNLPVPNGVTIEFVRQTPINTPAVVFGGGASLSSENLNKNSEYLTFALQEASDTNQEFTKLYLGSFNEFPTTDNDGDTLQVGSVIYFVPENALYYYSSLGTWIIGESTLAAQTFANAASASAAAAAASQAAALVSQNAAATSQSAAASSASSVATSASSASASATAAASSASAALASQGAAAGSASSASTSAGSAATSASSASSSASAASSSAASAAGSASAAATSQTTSAANASYSEDRALAAEASATAAAASATSANTSAQALNSAVSQDTSVWLSGTGTTESLVSPAKVRAAVKPAVNATGAAPIYAPRAWVRFTSGGGIFGSGNVSSIQRNAAGDYYVFMSTPMPDANYAVSVTAEGSGFILSPVVSEVTSGSFRIFVKGGSNQNVDANVSVIVVR